MLKKPKCPVIALEEHYWDKEIASQFVGAEGTRDPKMLERLYDLGELRLKEMDEAGIDMQILSHGAPSAQKLSGPDAVAITRRANDRLHAAVAANPKRFAAFAALPTIDPQASADELERTVKLGFKGAMLHGLANGVFLDDKRFWPIYERAQALDVPIYFHPAAPHPAVIEAYYKEYVQSVPTILSAGWGFTVETATTALRLVLSGLFQQYPKLKVILGHLGEGIPFLMARMDEALSRQAKVDFRATFSSHFSVTTSGFFSNPALLCCLQELGIDRILFSVDWPFVKNTIATEWVKTVPLCREDKVKLLSGNAKRLLKM